MDKRLIISADDPRAVDAVEAIHVGDIDRLRALVQEYPELATVALGNADDGEKKGMSRTLLHVVTDWPGHFPNGAEAVGVLVDAGADVNARFTGPHTETPLHWAASSDDVEVLDALLDHGADIEALGAVIGGGTPISDATAFGQWNVARRLLERGATTTFWESATLGLRDRVDAFFDADPPPSSDDITEAFWGACHGGQLAMAEFLLPRVADINWVGWDELTALDAARRSEASEVVALLEQLGARSNKETG
jgi:hypothetical protein